MNLYIISNLKKNCLKKKEKQKVDSFISSYYLLFVDHHFASM